MGSGDKTITRRRLDFSRWRLPGRQWHKALPVLALGLTAYWLGQQASALLAPSAGAYRDLAPAQPQAAAAAAAQGHWFGEAPQQATAAPPPVRLLGVYAPSREGVQGFAIIDSNGHPEPLLQGKQTPDGWELVKVAPNGITLRSGGNEQFVPLQQGGGGAQTGGDMPQSLPQPSPAMPPAQPMPGAMPVPVPGQVPDAQPQPAVDPAAMIRQ
ncbi:type II secretion system protein N [Chromobacterium phragmitis]|uniref:Type II secretion system protein N n=1 Tax=Chromobacterium phragmitis TaxID=2202141 RepID=A0ABV0IY27_9NEIS